VSSTRHVIGNFTDKSVQAIDCTGSDNRTNPIENIQHKILKK